MNESKIGLTLTHRTPKKNLVIKNGNMGKNMIKISTYSVIDGIGAVYSGLNLIIYQIML